MDPGWRARIEHTGALSGIYADYHYYGTGDRGGAPGEDSVRWVERSIAGSGPVRIVSSTAQQMFRDLPDDARAKLPRYQGDLLLIEHSAGSLTSQSYMKRWNRKNELLADAAERSASAAAWLGGAPYPTEKLYHAWDLTLGSQMHDMLPGTSLPKAYEYCWNDDVLSANQFAAVVKDSAGAVVAALDTSSRLPEGVPLVVYNPLSAAREDVAEGSLPGNETVKAVRVLDPDGKEVLSQVTRCADGKVDFLFLARVPSVSFTSFEACAIASEIAARNPTALQVTDRTLENARYRVTVNDAGDVASIFDKAANRELLAAPMRLEFHQENPRQYPAWNMDWSDRQKPARGYVDGPASIRVVEQGPVRATLEIERRAEGSRFVSRVSLAAGEAGNAVEFHDKIDWGTREACLKMAFPLTVSNPLAAYDDKVGVAMRGNNVANKYEVPQHEWFDLTDKGGGYGVSVLNDCKFGSDKPDDHTMRLTLLYSPGVQAGFQDQATQDWGRHDMAYAVAGHPSGWQQAGSVARAHRFNQPLRVFSSAAHSGASGRSLSFAALDNSQVEITAIKRAEDSQETVVRLRETGGQTAQVARLRFGAPILAVREVDGQERLLEHPAAAADLRDGQLSVSMAPYSLRAFALKLGAPAGPVAPPTALPVTLAFDEDVISTRANRADGSFDHEGRTFPAEMLPPEIVSEGIPFHMGPTADGQNNAVSCRGQTVPLPPGGYNRVFLLAAAADGDKAVRFQTAPGGGETRMTVQDWGGYLGQWDNRLWKGDVPELTYDWNNPLDGLVPGFVKPDTVAWFSSHRHERGGTGIYQYCYLFKYGLDLPPGARFLVLPNEPSVRVFAVTVARNSHDAAQPARELFDTLADHQADAPAIFEPAPGRYNDTVMVTCAEPLYWQDGGLRYTINGSEPTLDSPRWTGPLLLHASATVRARMYLPPARAGGPVATARYEIDDRTAPTLRSAHADTLLPTLHAAFSEPLEKVSAESAGGYRLEPGNLPIQSAKLAQNGMDVLLELLAPLKSGIDYQLVATGMRDLSPASNATIRASCAVTLSQPVYFRPETVVCDGQQSFEVPVSGLPVGANDPWTINFFVRTDHEPGNRTLIAGFGEVTDNTGKARYLSKFANGIHFWSANRDGETSAPIDTGRWQMLTTTYDGTTVRIYKDAAQIGSATLQFADDKSVVNIAPLEPWDRQRRFQGRISGLSIWKEAVSSKEISFLLKNTPGDAD